MKKIRVGLAGLGVVGKSVYDILTNNKNFIDTKTSSQIELVAVSSRVKKDFVDEVAVKFYNDPLLMASDPAIDVVIEVIGGDGIAKELALKTLQNGKKFITANKALLAVEGFELAKIAEENHSSISFEAGVGGAMPIVKIFKESLASNKINSFCAILNGTCNYILTKMGEGGDEFADALLEAQKLGFAESDPTFDIDGIDTAHKLALLASIALSSKPNFDEIYVEGIRNITSEDIKIARELGYKIKLLAVFENAGEASFQAVYPALVAQENCIAKIDGSLNAVMAKTSFAGETFVSGSGAGGVPTASAVLADLIDLANDRGSFVFGVKSDKLVEAHVSSVEERIGKYFVKFNLGETREIDREFLRKVKATKSYFHETPQGLVAGLITGDILEKELSALLKDKGGKFIRVA